jgi:hypothetical protein
MGNMKKPKIPPSLPPKIPEQPAVINVTGGAPGGEKPQQTWYKESGVLYKQEFGFKSTHGTQLELDLWGTQLEDKGKKITLEAVGIDVTGAQSECKDALAIMLSNRNYRGIGKVKTVTKYNWTGNLEIEFTLAEYLRAYGLQKKPFTTKNKTGGTVIRQEYQRGEVETAISALRQLATKDFALYFTEEHYDTKDKALKYDMLRTIDRLFRFIEGWNDLTEIERETIKSGEDTIETDTKRAPFRVVFNPLWAKGITEGEKPNFILTPANWRQEIGILEETRPEIFDTTKGGIGRTRQALKYPIRFIKYLRYQHKEKTAKNRPMNDRIPWKTIAETLRIADKTINRNPAAAKKIIHKCLTLAIELSYLKTGEIKGDWLEYTLNEDRFYKTEDPELE